MELEFLVGVDFGERRELDCRGESFLSVERFVELAGCSDGADPAPRERDRGESQAGDAAAYEPPPPTRGKNQTEHGRWNTDEDRYREGSQGDIDGDPRVEAPPKPTDDAGQRSGQVFCEASSQIATSVMSVNAVGVPYVAVRLETTFPATLYVGASRGNVTGGQAFCALW